jgi:hypothetical protein|tara:strand:- start:74 stop:490 length:417 start_codon:yes stop_codon:yes gene_type:complete
MNMYKDQKEDVVKVGVCNYQPGNGTRYNLVYGYTPNVCDLDGPNQFFCSWMKRGGSGGATVKHSAGGYCHWSYVKEKMAVGGEDAKAIAHFINQIICLDYEPTNDVLPRGLKEEPDMSQWTPSDGFNRLEDQKEEETP